MTAVKADPGYEWDEDIGCRASVKPQENLSSSARTGNRIFFLFLRAGKSAGGVPSDGGGVSYNDISGHQIPSGLQKLTWSGVFQGDSDGNFCGSRTLTRAQMAVLMARVLDAEEETIGEICRTTCPGQLVHASRSLRDEAGSVAGQPLSPDRPVTRQGTGNYGYRIVRICGQMKEASHFDKKSKRCEFCRGYAEEAYEYLNGSGYDVPSDILKDNVIDNSKIEIGLLPANPVTRLDAAAYLESFIQDFMRTNVQRYLRNRRFDLILTRKCRGSADPPHLTLSRPTSTGVYLRTIGIIRPIRKVTPRR